MARARVLIVDDSVVVRKTVADGLGAEPDIEVVGVAANGRIALAKLTYHPVDVVILDVEMPEMDGLATLRELRRRPTPPRVIMFSSHTTELASATVEALALGAADCVAKPSCMNGADAALVGALRALAERIRMLTRPRPGPTAAPRREARTEVTPRGPGSAPRIEVVVIGASTGGPNALCQIFARLPAQFPVPILIVQHMLTGFTKPLAERLTRESRIQVEEATDGTPLLPGKAWIAPGGRHMVVRRYVQGLRLQLHDEPPVWSCRPAVDVLFQSVATAFPRSALAVVLTGMGEDGKLGAQAIRKAGGGVLVQDEQSSVVWGMAGAIANAGLADAVLPIDELGDAIVRRAGKEGS